MGDAILAVFPAGGDAPAACDAALAAAREALRATAAGTGDDVRYTVALHFGTVSYGNVGASNRLDFTVIGRAVNLASRLNALGKDIDREIVLSADFAALCREPATLVGSHLLRGMPGEYAVYVPDRLDA